MNKQKIIDEINKTKEYLTNIEKMLEEFEYERWEPENGEEYFYVDNVGIVQNALFDNTMGYHLALCRTLNCFKTEEEAQQEAEKILVRKQLEDIARRLNKGQEINWNDNNQLKYNIGFDFPLDIISIGALYRKLQGSVYCLSDKFKDVAIQEIGEERLKKYLRGEQCQIKKRI